MKPILLFCTGLSGSGKSYFIRNHLPMGLFYGLKSATTRPMRPGEQDGREYYFRDEAFFDRAPLVTRIWANDFCWAPGKPKWLYGVPESEFISHIGQNLTYDVIQPKYVRQMIDWCHSHNLARVYNFKIAYFLPPENRTMIVTSRANMPDDDQVRRTNTCAPIDFLRAGLDIDFLVKCSADETIIPAALHRLIQRTARHQK